jgi:rod shape-determining protein MreC
LLRRFSNKRLIILLIGLIFFITLMGLTLVQRGKTTWPEMFLKDTVSWTQTLFYKPSHAVSVFFRDLRELFVVYEENQVLKQTLAQYARDTVRLNELEAQNIRLKDALQFTESQKKANDYIWRIAEVISASPDLFNNTVVIDLGEKHGIKENMAVMSVDGLIGRVVRVFPFHSNVQLLTDINERNPESKAIAATIKGKEDSTFGIVESFDRERGLLVMSKIGQNDKVEEGDLVITSRLSQVFPRGIVIGEVVSIREGDFGITRVADIKPAANMTHLHEVFVIEVPEVE